MPQVPVTNTRKYKILIDISCARNLSYDQVHYLVGWIGVRFLV